MSGVIDGDTTRIRLNNNYRLEISLHQGVDQCRITSTANYKSYIDPLMSVLENLLLSVSAGPYYCGAPTCADDLVLISSSPYDIQAMLTTVFQYSARSLYVIHPQKSQIVTNGEVSPPECFLCDFPVPVSYSLIHLGMRRRKNELVPTSLVE
jgi:hypothetical protein